MELIKKKSVIGPVISVFIMILVVSILAGLTFILIAQLKAQVVTATRGASLNVINETGWINTTAYFFRGNNVTTGFVLTSVTATNATGQLVGGITSGNYSTGVNSQGAYFILGTGNLNWSTPGANLTYSGTYVGNDSLNAYLAVNTTEGAGTTVTSYLSLIFLAVIFGAILTLVLKIILPYVNLGQSVGGF